MFSMNDFVLYFKMGLKHVLDFSAYDHILFLIVLAVVFNFKQWRKVMWLVTLFTIGHSITLALSAYEVLKIRMDLIEFLIPLTIIITAIINILIAKKSPTGKENINLVFALIFGLIHGLGFSNYFKLLIGSSNGKFFPLLEFAMGVELAQIAIVLVILSVGFVVQTIFRFSKRDWILMVSSIVIGAVISMLKGAIFW